MLAANAKVLAELEAMTVLDVQVMTLLAALQLQLAACAPDRATAPLATLNWAGSTSTTVIKPLVGTAAMLDTVRE